MYKVYVSTRQGAGIMENHVGVFQSGKLVTRMFQRLHDYMVDPELLVCVLIDEVNFSSPSLASALTHTCGQIMNSVVKQGTSQLHGGP